MEWLALVIAGAVLAVAFAFAWLVNRATTSAATIAVAEKDKTAAEHRAAEAVKAQETRDETSRSSFGDAVDRL